MFRSVAVRFLVYDTRTHLLRASARCCKDVSYQVHRPAFRFIGRYAVMLDY